MKTHRLTLLLTETEKERIEQQAAALGTSTSDYVRRAVTLLDAEDVVALGDIHSLMPEFDAALARIHTNLVAAAESSERNQQEIARMRTPEYREEIRRSIIEDERDLDAVASLFGFARPEPAVSDAEPPKRGTLFERIRNFARARSHVSEPHQPWQENDPQRARKRTK